MSKYSLVGVDMSARRRDRRNALPPIAIEIEDKTYTTVDWSLGGFRILPYEGAGRVGDTLALNLVIGVAGESYRYRATAEVMRIDRRTGSLAASFKGLPPEAIDTLEGHLTGRLRRQARKRAEAEQDSR